MSDKLSSLILHLLKHSTKLKLIQGVTLYKLLFLLSELLILHFDEYH